MFIILLKDISILIQFARNFIVRSGYRLVRERRTCKRQIASSNPHIPYIRIFRNLISLSSSSENSFHFSELRLKKKVQYRVEVTKKFYLYFIRIVNAWSLSEFLFSWSSRLRPSGSLITKLVERAHIQLIIVFSAYGGKFVQCAVWWNSRWM